MRFLYGTGFIILLTWLAGCALSPQTINISPSVDLSKITDTGHGRRVALEVADNRGTRVVGRRGGVYATTSEISTSADIKTPIRNELSKSLQAMGYQVVPAGESADAELRLIVDQILYDTGGGNVVKEIETSATVRVVSRVDNREYTGRYRGKRTTEVLKAPDADKNEAMINAALSHVLERVLSDDELHKFMQGQG